MRMKPGSAGAEAGRSQGDCGQRGRQVDRQAGRLVSGGAE